MHIQLVPRYLLYSVLLIALTRTAFTQDPVPEARASNTTRIESEKHGFSLVPPEGWKKATFSRSAFLEFVGPMEQKLPNVNVRVVAYDGGDVRELCAALKAALSGGDDEWTPLSESFIDIDGHKAFFLTATQMNTTQGIRFKTKMLQCFIADKPNGYILTYSCLPELYDELLPSFEKSAKSSRIKQP